MNFFSSFDPSSSLFFIPNWVSAVICFIIIPQAFWVTKSQPIFTLKATSKYLEDEAKMALGINANPGIKIFLIAVFWFIACNNFMGLTPYVFTASSHLSFTLSLALLIWMICLLAPLIKDIGAFLAHLVPNGTPAALTPFMVLIELTSLLIRPITLSVRLAANMVAGHLLLTLISSSLPSVGYSLSLAVMSGLVMLMVLESAVALIQSYVFCTLSGLYVGEVSTAKVNP